MKKAKHSKLSNPSTPTSSTTRTSSSSRATTTTTTASKSKKDADVSKSAMFQLVDTVIRFRLHPCYIADPRRGVSDSLNQLMFRYWQPIGGVPLTVEKFQLASDKASLANDVGDPCLFLSAQCSLLAFVPIPGVTEGPARVTAVHAHYVSVIVHGLFTGRIDKPLALGDGDPGDQAVKLSTAQQRKIEALQPKDFVRVRITSVEQVKNLGNFDGMDLSCEFLEKL